MSKNDGQIRTLPGVKHQGTTAYGNLVDLLRGAQGMLGRSDDEILLARPELLGLEAAGVSATEMGIRQSCPAATAVIFPILEGSSILAVDSVLRPRSTV